jgi:hypothetical protein
MAPLVIDGDDGRYVEFQVDVPIGVVRESRYHEAVVTVPSNATLVAFTDGLVERRGEVSAWSGCETRPPGRTSRSISCSAASRVTSRAPSTTTTRR